MKRSFRGHRTVRVRFLELRLDQVARMKKSIREHSTHHDQYRCSFCGKSQEDVRRLVAGPGVYICDECVELCREIIAEGGLDASTPGGGQAEPEGRVSGKSQ